MPDLATKTDLHGLEQRMLVRLADLEATIARQTVQIIGIMTGIVALLDAILFVLLRFVH